MPKRRNYSAEFKREAVALAKNGSKAFLGQGVARDDAMVAQKRDNARLKKERDFLRESATVWVPVESGRTCATKASNAV